MAEDNRNKPLYMISVAAELTGMHPQTLRIYESKGLVNPQRSGGNTRLYSRADIERPTATPRWASSPIAIWSTCRPTRTRKT